MGEEEDQSVDHDVEDIEQNSGEKPGSSSTSPTRPTLGPVVSLRSGDVLTLDDAFRIMAAAETRVIVFGGDSESGKTTLLAAIFELFQRGPFAGYEFCGSQTMVAFEGMCWLGRVGSQAETPDNFKTPAGLRHYLHLPVRRNADNGHKQDMILVDISGEDFREARKSPAVCRELQELKRADHLVLVIDGAKLIEPSTRHVAVRNVREPLERFLDIEMIPSSPKVHVFISKYDKIHKLRSDHSVHQFIEGIGEQFHSKFDGRVESIEVFKVAARPFSSELKLGYGLADPFAEWVDIASFPSKMKASIEPTERASREFDKYSVEKDVRVTDTKL